MAEDLLSSSINKLRVEIHCLESMLNKEFGNNPRYPANEWGQETVLPLKHNNDQIAWKIWKAQPDPNYIFVYQGDKEYPLCNMDPTTLRQAFPIVKALIVSLRAKFSAETHRVACIREDYSSLLKEPDVLSLLPESKNA